MGLLSKLFGGGTQLELTLDLDKVPPGGTVAGTITLTGGKKPLTLTALKVEVVAVLVESKVSDDFPKIDIKVLSSQIIAQDRALAPGSRNKFELRCKLPEDANPAASYKVQATADIPGVKDPSAEAALKVVGASRGGALGALKSLLGRGASEDEVLARFPGLASPESEEVEAALHELQCEAYDRDNNFTGAHAFLLRLVETHREADVRKAALAAWGTVLDNRAKPEHIRALEALAARDLPSDLMQEVVTVAAKFAEEGALPLVQQLTRHPSPQVRARLASALYFDADRELPGRRELILGLCQDADVGVRAAAFGACASLVEHLDVVTWVIACARQERSPEVQRACISAIPLAIHHGGTDHVFTAFLEHARNPSSEVREEVASSLHWLPADPRLTQLVEIIFADPDPEVRRQLAWQGQNMSEHLELRDHFLHAATRDPDESVRADALRSVGKLLDLPAAVNFVRQRLAHDRNEKAHWAALSAVEDFLPAREARELVTELSRGPYSSVAERARELLAGA